MVAVNEDQEDVGRGPEIVDVWPVADSATDSADPTVISLPDGFFYIHEIVPSIDWLDRQQINRRLTVLIGLVNNLIRIIEWWPQKKISKTMAENRIILHSREIFKV